MLMTDKELLACYREHFEIYNNRLVWRKPSSLRTRVGDIAGYVDECGKYVVQLYGRRTSLGSVVYALTHGYIAKYVRHKDGNFTNNSADNLEERRKK